MRLLGVEQAAVLIARSQRIANEYSPSEVGGAAGGVLITMTAAASRVCEDDGQRSGRDQRKAAGE